MYLSFSYPIKLMSKGNSSPDLNHARICSCKIPIRITIGPFD